MIYLDWASSAAAPTVFPAALGTTGDTGDFVGGAADQEHLYRSTLAFNLNVESLSVNLYDIPANRAGDFRLTLREDNAGSPGDLLAVTDAVNEIDYTAGELVTLAVTPVVITAGDYWLGIHIGGEAVEVEVKDGAALERGRCADTFSDGTSVTAGVYTDLSSTKALMIWANGTAV